MMELSLFTTNLNFPELMVKTLDLINKIHSLKYLRSTKLGCNNAKNSVPLSRNITRGI